MPGAAPYRRARAATSNALRQGTPATGKQLPGTRRLYKSGQPLRLSPCYQPAEVRDPVVSAPLVLQRRVGTLVGLLDQAVSEHALDRTVQRARTKPGLPSCSPFDLAHDPVPVPPFIGKRQQNVQHSRG